METVQKHKVGLLYKELQGYINAVVWEHIKSYGGDFEELKSQANVIFINAVNAYNSNRGTKLSTWITFKIKTGLLDNLRSESKNVLKIATKIDDVFVNTYSVADKMLPLMEFIDEISVDACIALQVFFDIPKDTALKIRKRCKGKQNRFDRVQAALRNCVCNRLRQKGWTPQRMSRAFEELKT